MSRRIFDIVQFNFSNEIADMYSFYLVFKF